MIGDNEKGDPTEPEEEEGEGGEEGLAEAAAEPMTGRTPADSATSDGPEGDVDDPDAVDYVELAKIHNVRERNEARIIKGILESFHIPCMIEDDVSDVLSGMLPTELDGIDILVPAQFAEKARAVLCERNIVCGIDKGRLEALLAEADDAAAPDPARCAELAKKVAAETRDYRHEALAKIGRRGDGGFALARALLAAGVRAGDDNPVGYDIAYLTDLGTFGKDRALLVLADLGKLAKDPDAGVRKRVARALGRLHGVGSAPALVDFLLDDDAGVRDEALESLYSLSNGETFDFDPDLTPAGQQDAVTQWRAWVRDNPGI